VRHLATAKSAASAVDVTSDLSPEQRKEKADLDGRFMNALKLLQAGKSEEAQSAMSRLVEEYRRLPHPDGVIRTLNTLGLACAKQKDYSGAVRYINESLDVARALPAPPAELIGKLLQQLAAAYSQLGNVAEAVKAGEEALRLAQQRRDVPSEAAMHMTLGSMQSPQRDAARGNYQVAVKHFAAAAKLYESSDDVNNQISALVLVAREHAAARNLDLSNKAWDQVLQICEGLPSRVEEWEVCARTVETCCAVVTRSDVGVLWAGSELLANG
jgi:tetratricopeptide (TPR) repeat protein